MMLSALGNSEPRSTSDETSRPLRETSQLSMSGETKCPQMMETSGPSSNQQTCDTLTLVEGQSLETLQLSSTSYETHLEAETVSGHIKEMQSLDSKPYESYVNSEQACVSASGTHSVLEASDVIHSNQNGDAVPSTCALSSQPDMDHSIATSNMLSSSTPLDADDSIVTRTVPASSACIVDIGQQFTAHKASLTHHGQYSRSLLTALLA